MSSFEIKGKVAPCTLFRPLVTDMESMARDVDVRLGETPQFFRNMAVIIDLAGLGPARDEMDLAELVALLREHGLTPVGIQGAGEDQERLACELRLGVFREGKQPAGRMVAETPGGCGAEVGAMIVDKPVRSGQQVYAKGRDLVVLAPVGPGAEVIADGNIHVYAPLRGRALAGAMGYEAARIYCKELRAELISVAGLYRVSEDMPEALHGASVQARLNGRQLLIESL